jgi:iron complex outermembrane receptor protein
VKGDFFSHRVSLNTDAYYGKLRNEQVSNAAYIPALNNSLAVTGNVGQTRIYGIEADGSWAVTRILSVSGTFSWNHVSVLSYLCVSCEAVIGTSNVNGNDLGNAPTFSGSLAADLRDQIGHTRWNWFSHADYVYRGPEHLDVNNAGSLHSRSIVNVRAGVDRKGMAVEAFIANLTNDRHYSGGSQGLDFATGSYTAFDFGVPPPRIFGGRISFSF